MQESTSPQRRRWRPRPLYAASLALAVAGLLAACGSSASKASSATTASGNPASSAPASGSAGTAGAGAGTGAGTAAPVESSPPGDIPDTVAYPSWTSPDGKTTFVHPEGWSQTTVPGGVTFTDKLNSVTVTSSPGVPPTVASVDSQVNPTLGGPGRATKVVRTEAATLPAGPAVRITWQVNSLPAEVTGKVYRDEVMTYLVGQGGRVVRMDLSGAIGSDNVDPYRKMSQSLVLR
ncbi:MAG: hypothetical protein M3256_03930 [Actinomycetota bacterium]|nr:hypothetical protein [Actinomycetota bacterium]